jgi:hypothetical protein
MPKKKIKEPVTRPVVITGRMAKVLAAAERAVAACPAIPLPSLVWAAAEVLGGGYNEAKRVMRSLVDKGMMDGDFHPILPRPAHEVRDWRADAAARMAERLDALARGVVDLAEEIAAAAPVNAPPADEVEPPFVHPYAGVPISTREHPLSRATSALFGRAAIRGGVALLDGRPVAPTALVAEANAVLAACSFPLIAYPGVAAPQVVRRD